MLVILFATGKTGAEMPENAEITVHMVQNKCYKFVKTDKNNKKTEKSMVICEKV